MKESNDITIIGGGMMGSTLALLLAKALPNRKIGLVDKSSFKILPEQQLTMPSFDARSTALAPTTVELMEYVGVWQDMLPYATSIKSVQVSDTGHSGWTRLSEKDNRGQALGYVVDNRAMGRALVNAVVAHNRINIYSQSEVKSLKAIPDGFQMTLVDDSLQQSNLVLVADGANSSLGHSLGIQQTQTSYGQCAVVANVEFERPHCGTAFERFTDKGPLALLPLGGENGRTSALVWTWPEDESATAMAMDDSTFLSVLHQRFGYRLGNFTKVSARVCYPLTLCLANEQVRSHLVMMGNAAHFLHPVAGQGFNLSARDSLRLADTLKNAPEHLGDLSVLMRYQQAQASDQLRTIFLSHGFNAVFGSSHLSVIGLRNLGMLAIENFSAIRNIFIRQLSGRANAKVLL